MSGPLGVAGVDPLTVPGGVFHGAMALGQDLHLDFLQRKEIKDQSLHTQCTSGHLFRRVQIACMCMLDLAYSQIKQLHACIINYELS